MTGKLWPQRCIAVSDTPFCAYLKYNLKTVGYLQVYYTAKDSSTTKDALFHVKSCKSVTTNKLWPCTNITVLFFFAQVRISGCLRLYYDTITTAFLPRLHLLEIQTEVQLMSCVPVASPCLYLLTMLIKILHSDDLYIPYFFQ